MFPKNSILNAIPIFIIFSSLLLSTNSNALNFTVHPNISDTFLKRKDACGKISNEPAVMKSMPLIKYTEIDKYMYFSISEIKLFISSKFAGGPAHTIKKDDFFDGKIFPEFLTRMDVTDKNKIKQSCLVIKLKNAEKKADGTHLLSVDYKEKTYYLFTTTGPELLAGELHSTKKSRDLEILRYIQRNTRKNIKITKWISRKNKGFKLFKECISSINKECISNFVTEEFINSTQEKIRKNIFWEIISILNQRNPDKIKIKIKSINKKTSGKGVIYESWRHLIQNKGTKIVFTFDPEKFSIISYSRDI